MKLGMIDYSKKYKEETFIQASERKLDFLEYCINIGIDVDEFYASTTKIKKWSNKHKVAIGSIGRWGTNKIDCNGKIIENEQNISYKLIDAASDLECDNFICGCNYIENLSYFENCVIAIEYFSKLIKYAEKKGVRISTYNCRWNNFVYNDLSWNIIHGHLKKLGIKYDPSHCRYDNGDYLSEMKKWGNRFNHVHIKGSLIVDGKRLDDPPAGLDDTNWGAFMSVLYAKGYNRGLSIEPHSEIWKNELGQKGIDYTINIMKKLIF